MNYYKRTSTAIFLAALLLQGCGDSVTPTEKTSLDTLENSTLDTSLNSVAPTLAVANQSLVNTRHNLQRELVQSNARRATASTQQSEYTLSDIIYAYVMDDKHSEEGAHLQTDSARTFLNAMIDKELFTADEIEEINNYSDEEVNQLFIAAFFNDTDALVGRETLGFGSKLKDIGRKVTKEIDRAVDKVDEEVDRVVDDVEDEVKRVIDDIEKVTDKVEEETQRVVDDVEDEVKRVVDDIESAADKVEEETERVVDDVKDVAKKFDDEIIDPVREKVESEIIDPVKDVVTDVIIDTYLGQKITAEIFKLMLEDEGITNEMLRLAIKSQTITDIMVGVMKENWGLTKKMVPLLEDPNDTHFSQLFTQLALKRQGVAPFLFTYIDAPMYSAVGTAMLHSAETTENMGKLMEIHAKDYFIIPTAPYFESHSQDKFPEMIFYSGEDSVRGDGFEFQNEKFFYALFQNSKATRSFIIAMNQLDPDVRKTFMDVIFLGKYSLPSGVLNDLNTTQDESILSVENTTQAYMNIYAIAGGMAFGIKTEGFETYKESFVDFAKMVPYDRYFPYGKNFSTATYYYFKAHGIDTAPLTSLTTEVMFNYDASTQEAPLRTTLNTSSEDNTTQENNEEEGLTLLEKLFAKLDTVKDAVGNSFGSYTEWWSSSKEQFKALSLDIFSGVEALNFESIKDSLHTKTQESVQVKINDNNFTLPPFDEINVVYIKDQVKTRLTDYIKGIDKDWIAEYSEHKYVKEYLYDGLKNSELWAYIPNWMAKMDWLKIPANANFDTFKVNLAAGTLEVYLISKNDNLAELQTILGNNVLLREIDMNGDEPLSTELDATFNVYAFDIKASDVFNIDFKVLKDKVSAIGFNKQKSQIEASPESD